MSEPFVAEVRIWALNFAPRGWAFCDGQLLQIAQNTALFSLVGTTYGGDGRTTFGLPNLQGRAPMHAGNGPGLTSRLLGSAGGAATVTLTTAQMPNHRHTMFGDQDPAEDNSPAGAHHARTAANARPYATAANLQTSGIDLDDAGGSGAHNNLMPYLVLNFCIALVGLYPSRS